MTYAKDVTEEQALKVARSFWQATPLTRSNSPSLKLVFHSESIPATRSSGLSPAYYVFDNTSGPGFVVVAGDDVAMPVLGYSFESEFTANSLPRNLQAWLETMRGEVNEARRAGVQAQDAVTRAWSSFAAGTPVVELETAKWNQERPYNLLCPIVNGTESYTGCTATALAIVMRYHQWPEKGTGTLPGYRTGTYGVQIADLPLGHTYNWANMPLQFPYSGYSQVQANEVATLMRDCGIMLQSDYGPLGSIGTSAFVSDIPAALVTYMGYDKSARNAERASYNTNEWYNLMKNELNNNRPVLYSGSSDQGGHAFVLDGYTDDNYFSVNWGWGGYCDGYFLLTALDPDGQGAGGSGSYNDMQYAVIGIQKDAGGNYVEDLRFTEYKDETTGRVYNGLSVDSAVSSGVPFLLYVGLLSNQGSSTFVGETMFAVTDKDGNIVEELHHMDIPDLPLFYGYCLEQEVTITGSILPGYRIRAYYRSANTPEWTVIRGNDDEGCTWDYLIADEQSIDETTQLTYNKASRMLRLQVEDGVTVALQTADGNDRSDVCKTQGNEIRIDTSALSGGAYRLILQKGDEKKTLNITLPDISE